MDSSFYVSLGTVVTTVLLLVYIRLLNLQRLRLPPGPRAWPVVGNLPHLGKTPHVALQELSKKYGPVMFMKLGSVPAVVISSPDMVKEFLITQGDMFASRPKNLSREILSYNGQSIVQSDYVPIYHLLRRICTVELLSAKRIREFQDVRTEELMATVQSIMEEGKDGQPVNDLFNKLIAVNNNNITRMLFQKRYCEIDTGMATQNVAGDEREFHKLLASTVDVFADFFLGNYFPYLSRLDFGGLRAKMWKLRNGWDALFEIIINQHQSRRNEGQSQETRQDFVDVLLSIRDKEDKLSDENIKGLLKDLLLGGTDTTANQTAWGMAELVRNPDVQKKLQEELDTIVGRDRLVSESDIPHLPYLQAFVNECFRRHTVLPLLVPHQSNHLKPVQVAGYEIPPKTRLFVNAYAIHMDPTVWKNPLEFDPERFLNKPIQIKGQDFEVLPFGAGRRSCPGMTMGLLMVQITVAQLAHAFEWSLPEGTDPAVLDDVRASRTIYGPKLSPFNISLRLPLALYTTDEKKILSQDSYSPENSELHT